MAEGHPSRGPGLVMMLVFWVLLMALGGWWVNGWLERRDNPNAGLVSIAGDEALQLKRGADGHYRAPGTINGQEVRFLLDTGASVVSVPSHLADQLGLRSMGAVRLHTANGTVNGSLVRLDTVGLGGLTAHDVRGAINPGSEGDRVLLGMSFLKRFDIVIRGDILELKVPAGGIAGTSSSQESGS
ncbi:retropepsin-like aspartic protease family protein [Halomonas huangheensis]|uniref:Peptidase A2 domain-containing protein n=1 Tax=Halomonas huangheensis TaxID=1178482 RepID=W1NBI0_9GAMM|nr:retropepsin-like aspartic protease [Halomonas huangheensis]ALM53787.1 hypothetical protein AR456_17035 [Halomonas huangheensis]ERL52285.1 hypothetical protein BJB45_09975 [Halomonas huangheensis]